MAAKYSKSGIMDKIKDEVSDEIFIIAASGETEIGSAGEQLHEE